MQFTINTSRKNKGKAAKTIKVTTNDAENPNPTLVCETTVKVPLEVDPSLVNFGTIERTSEAVKKTYKIKRGDGGPIKPEIKPFKDPNLKASLREIAAGEEYELDVEMAPPWPNKAVQGYLNLTTGIDESPEFKVRYYARVAARLRAVPNRISVPDDLTSELNTRVRLYWSGGNAGKVLDVTATDPKIKTQIVEDKGQQYVQVTIPAGYKAPRAGNYVKLTTDDKEAAELQIQVVPRRTPKAATATPARAQPGSISTGNQPILRPRPGLDKPAAAQPIKPAPQNQPAVTPEKKD